jgi:hypothetical protein
MTHPHMWHDSSLCHALFIRVWYDSSTYVTWLIHICDMTHLYAMPDSYVYHASFACIQGHCRAWCARSHRRRLLSCVYVSSSHLPIFVVVFCLASMCSSSFVLRLRRRWSQKTKDDEDDPIVFVFCLASMCHSHVRPDTFACASWHIQGHCRAWCIRTCGFSVYVMALM